MNNQVIKDLLSQLMSSASVLSLQSVEEKKTSLKMKQIKTLNKINELLQELLIINAKLEKD
jgi:hypothetical protein